MHNQNILKPNQASDSTLSIAIKAVWMMTVLTLLLGVAYPLVMTGLAQAIFPNQANGSLVQDNGITVGSQLIGQDFSSTPYFQSRPSMTTETLKAVVVVTWEQQIPSNNLPLNNVPIHGMQRRVVQKRFQWIC